MKAEIFMCLIHYCIPRFWSSTWHRVSAQYQMNEKCSQGWYLCKVDSEERCEVDKGIRLEDGCMSGMWEKPQRFHCGCSKTNKENSGRGQGGEQPGCTGSMSHRQYFGFHSE